MSNEQQRVIEGIDRLIADLTRLRMELSSHQANGATGEAGREREPATAGNRSAAAEGERTSVRKGDSVRIINPNPGQEEFGKVTKIGTGLRSRVTVRTPKGQLIQRAKKNLQRVLDRPKP